MVRTFKLEIFEGFTIFRVAVSECLNVMLVSLDQAPLNKSHIPALFFLAETCLYYLRTDAVSEPYLRCVFVYLC